MNKKVSFKQGFTLIELLVVLVILGLLATFMGPRVLSYTDDARVSKAQNDMLVMDSAIKRYKIDTGIFPTTEQGIISLIEEPDVDPIPKGWRTGGYLEANEVPKDPWGNDYIYRSPSEVEGLDYEIISLGADGKEGGEDYEADIRLDEIK